MFKTITAITKKTKSRILLAGTVSAFALMIATTSTIANPQSASADSCDPVNIVYCGINGSGINGYINSFQQEYNGGSNNGHGDLKAVYRWSGATNASVDRMNASNTKMGTLYRNGDIKVDGKVVGHDAWVTARFNSGAGFQEVTPGVWARKTTTSFAEAQAQVIVHFNNDGSADFAVMTGCGNAIKFTPNTPPTPPVQANPMPSTLICKDLTATQVGTTRRYNFIAKANATNTDISKYIFEFGDGEQRAVATANNAAAVAHTYAKDGKSYTAKVTVKSADGKQDSGADCKVTITTPVPPTTPTLICNSLTSQQTLGKKLTYQFVAKATPTKTTITSYVFTFSDGTATTVNTGAISATVSHTFAQNDTTYVTSVAVNSNDLKNVTSAACKVSLKTPKVDECKPGVPVGSPACETPTTPECAPGIPEGSSECTPDEELTVTPTGELVHTGPGSVLAIFAAFTAVGVIGYNLVSRRVKA